MGNFLTIVFFLGFCILIYLFLKSPQEIIKNFFKGVGNFFINVIPLGFLVKNAIQEDRDLAKEKKIVEELSLIENSDFTFKIDVQDFECFVLLNGHFKKEMVQDDISKAISHLDDRIIIDVKYQETGTVHIAKLTGLTKLSDIMRLIRYLSKEYGIDNTFGYLKNGTRKVFFQKSIDNESHLIGSTDEEKHFYYSVASFKPECDFVIFTDSVFFNPDLNTSFFEHLVNSSHD